MTDRPIPARQRPGWRRRTCHDDGYVTAESAVVLPVVALFAVGLLWMIGLGVTQVRLVDAARDAARSLARGDAAAVARAYGARSAPPGSSVRFAAADDAVTVTVRDQVEAPGWLLLPLPSVTLQATATAPSEGALSTVRARGG